MIMGDFIAHNPVWESVKVTDKRKNYLSLISVVLYVWVKYIFTSGQWILFLYWLNTSRPFYTLDLHWPSTVHDDLISVEVIISLSLLKGMILWKSIAQGIGN